MCATPARLWLRCPAKVNLALSVGRADAQGMHPLASWMVGVEYADELVLRRLDQGPSRFEIRFDPGCPAVTGCRVDWPLETDLAFRAHRCLEEHAGQPLPVELKLTKCIPTGAGLGGGSSNAASTLVGLRRLFSLEVDAQTVLRLAGGLGSDVPFLVTAVLGRPSALVTGLGETVEPRVMHQALDLVLIFPPPGVTCPTNEVYRAFDRLFPSPTHTDREPADPSRVLALMESSPLKSHLLFNDLAQPAYSVAPRLKQAHDLLERQLGVPVHVTGSGSTLFVLAPSQAACSELAESIWAKLGLHAIATRTLLVSHPEGSGP